MPQLWVRSDQGDGRVDYAPGQSLRTALLEAGLPVGGDCDGSGSCGRCRVCLDAPPPRTAVEHTHLTATDDAADLRLACQIEPTPGMRVVLVDRPAEQWRALDLPQGSFAPAPDVARAVAGGASRYGVAVDLGTTHLRVSLWDRSHPQRLSARIGPNPQAPFGADVLSRLTHALGSPSHAGALARLVSHAIAEAIDELASAHAVARAHIERVVVVGNTAMLALLTGRATGTLLDPDHWNAPIDTTPLDAGALREALRLDASAVVFVVPPVAGFVGSDLVAAITATDLCASPRRGLLIDFGTNTEVACWDGHHLHATSAAGGPAFEASGVSCGMPAVAGAIVHMGWTGTPPVLAGDVLGGGPAQGLSGSGLVDAIACLVDRGAVTAAGRFAGGARTHPLAAPPHRATRTLALTCRDLDAFQRAKAAIGAATAALLDRAGMGHGDVERLCVCGAFGEHLAPARAQAIGLLPPVASSCIELHGHAALTGAEAMLVRRDPTATWTAITSRARVLNLAHAPGYEDAFIAHLALRPVASQEAVEC